jgi:hypothetical protein
MQTAGQLRELEGVAAQHVDVVADDRTPGLLLLNDHSQTMTLVTERRR